jgi:hypothetical protein
MGKKGTFLLLGVHTTQTKKTRLSAPTHGAQKPPTRIIADATRAELARSRVFVVCVMCGLGSCPSGGPCLCGRTCLRSSHQGAALGGVRVCVGDCAVASSAVVVVVLVGGGGGVASRLLTVQRPCAHFTPPTWPSWAARRPRCPPHRRRSCPCPRAPSCPPPPPGSTTHAHTKSEASTGATLEGRLPA